MTNYPPGSLERALSDERERRRAEDMVARLYRESRLRDPGSRLGRSGVLALATAGTMLESGRSTP